MDTVFSLLLRLTSVEAHAPSYVSFACGEMGHAQFFPCISDKAMTLVRVRRCTRVRAVCLSSV